MLKHVQLSPYRTRSADTFSLSSNTSYSSLSPEPLSSRSSSYSSLSDATGSPSFPLRDGWDTPKESQYQTIAVWEPTRRESLKTTIKVYARCLRPDIEYKTLSITYQTTCREVVQSLLNKYRMRHRDPNLFYLTMEVTVRKAGVRTVLVLDEEARPAALQSCQPRGDSRFALQTRRGGLVKIYDSALMPGSQYKSLLISFRTTVDELIQILLNCYNSKERVEQFSLYEVCKSQESQRKLHPDDRPLEVQQRWLPAHEYHFLIRRNIDYKSRSTRAKVVVQWTPTLPCSSRQSLSLSSPESSNSEYENYFYI